MCIWKAENNGYQEKKRADDETHYRLLPMGFSKSLEKQDKQSLTFIVTKRCEEFDVYICMWERKETSKSDRLQPGLR